MRVAPPGTDFVRWSPPEVCGRGVGTLVVASDASFRLHLRRSRQHGTDAVKRQAFCSGSQKVNLNDEGTTFLPAT